MKLLNTFSGYLHIRIPHCNSVIWFDDPAETKLRKWNGTKSDTHLNQITKDNIETIGYAFRQAE